MTKTTVGYQKELLILAFDHRGSFQSKLFGIKGTPTPAETKEIASYKNIIYKGLKKAIVQGAPKEKAGILADEQFASDILNDAKKSGLAFALPAEKSGQDEFDFEFGSEFGPHIHKFQPSFVKVLVRYNPEDNAETNKRQATRLKQLSDYCHSNGYKFLFELLVPATQAQLTQVGGDKKRFDNELRADLTVQAIKALQNVGIEPDIWKLEGVDTVEQAHAISKAARSDGRDEVGTVVLGRGENGEKVHHWLRIAAKVPGFIGFAVGRTIFWDPLTAHKEGKITEDEAVDRIAKNYRSFVDTWQAARR